MTEQQTDKPVAEMKFRDVMRFIHRANMEQYDPLVREQMVKNTIGLGIIVLSLTLGAIGVGVIFGAAWSLLVIAVPLFVLGLALCWTPAEKLRDDTDRKKET